jgi:adenylate cyclase
LIEVSTGFHLWSQKYDRELDDVFKIQDEIALEIAHQLKVTLLGANLMPKTREQTRNVEAYQLYCKGRSLYYERGMALFEALKCFESALAMDPKYALAASGLADTYIMLSFHGYLSPVQCWSKAIPASQLALKYGPDLAEIHNTLAIISLLHDKNLDEAERKFKMALELNPLNIQARIWYALFLLTLTLSRFKEGIEQAKIAIENDPLSAYAYGCFGLVLATSGHIEESIAMCQDAVKLERTSMLASYSLGYCYFCAGEFEKALGECQKALVSSNRHAWNLILLMCIYNGMNKREEMMKIFREMQIRYKDGNLPPSNLAIAAALAGEDDFALELAHKAVDEFDPFLPYNGINFRTSEALRKIKGFDQIIDRLGFSGLQK